MNEPPANPSEDGNPTLGNLVPAAATPPAARDPYRNSMGIYGRPPGEAASDFQVDLLEYLRIIMKRRWLILSIVAVFLVSTTLTTLMKTPLYTSTVRLQIDRNVPKIVEGGNVMPVEGSDLEFMRTQDELIRSRTMAERVANTLKLGEDLSFFAPRSFSLVAFVKKLVGAGDNSASQGSKLIYSDGLAAAVVLGNRTVTPVLGSRLVDVSYSDPNPQRAQKIADGYADAFIASNLDKRFEANSYAKVFLEDQLKRMKLRLEQSEQALLAFGQKEEIVQTNNKASIAEDNLASANAALDALISERIKNEETWKQLEPTNAINLPQLLSNAVIEGLRVKRNGLEAEYQEKLETFKPNYPTMIQLSDQIAEIGRQLAAEVNTLKASYRAAYRSSLDQENEMRKRIGRLKQDVLDLQKRSIQYNILKREADTNRSLYDGLLQRYKEVNIAGGIGANNVFIVDKATLPGAPSSPRLSRALLLSLVLGLASALAVTFVLEHLDDTLRSPEEVERVLGYATLGIIPHVGSEARIEEELANPRSHMSESYRSLCIALQLSTEKGLPKTILVTSAGPEEGKSTTALTVARHFASAGLRVLLVDGDLRKPSLHTKLNCNNSVGLSNYLTGAVTPPELLLKTDIPNLAFLPSGPLPPNAADLLGSSRLLTLLSVGLEVFDLVVVDSPPVMALADAPLLSSAVTATIFAIGAGQIRTRFIRAAIKRLQFSRASLIGTVLTRFDVRSSYGYGYTYAYAYGSTHGRTSPANISIAGADGAARPTLTRAQVD